MSNTGIISGIIRAKTGKDAIKIKNLIKKISKPEFDYISIAVRGTVVDFGTGEGAIDRFATKEEINKIKELSKAGKIRFEDFDNTTSSGAPSRGTLYRWSK